MSDKLKYVLLSVLVSVLLGSLGALITGADKDTWKTVAPSSITGIFALLQNTKKDDVSQ